MADRRAPRPAYRAPRLARRAALPALLLAFSATHQLGCSPGEVPATEPAAEPRPPVETRVAVDRAVATTGDVITYSVTIEHEPGYEVELEEPGADIAGFRIVDLGSDEAQERDGRVIDRRWYRLRADLVGSYVLPPVTVTYRTPQGESSTLETSEIFVEVESVLPAGEEPGDIRDVKPLERLPRSWLWLWITLGAVLAVGAVFALWLWRRHRRGAAEAAALPAHVLALRDLDRLRRTNFADLAALRRYYFEISEVVRRYVEGRFALNATDLTTEEITARLGLLAELRGGQAEELRRFLLETDEVKFARHLPAETEIEGTYERALGFVEATVPEDSVREESVPEGPPGDSSNGQGGASNTRARPPSGPPAAAAGGVETRAAGGGG